MTAPKRAIIFAAGMGSRLGSYTKGLPKTLLNLGGLTIFDRAVIGLDKIDIKEIVVVTGYETEKLESHALGISRKLVQDRIRFEFILNSDLDIGNIYSFWLARSKMTEDFILLNSDVVFDYRILEILKKSQQTSALVIDKGKRLGEEEMKVLLDKMSVVKDISKVLDPSAAHGEYIGILKMNPEAANQVLVKVSELLEKRKFPLYYEDAFKLVAQRQDCLFACSTEGLAWTEIDTVDDMNYAKSIIMPQIENLA